MRHLLFAAIVCLISLQLASPAAAQRYRNPAPLATFDLTEQLAAELEGFRFETAHFFTDKHMREEVDEEFRDVVRDLEKLRKAIDKASRRPSKWDKVHDRAEDLEEELDDLAKEVRKQVRRQNLQWDRQRFHLNRHARPHGPAVRVVVGTGPIQSGPVLAGPTSASPLLAGPHVAGDCPEVAHSPGWHLESRVATMQWLARELHWLTHRR